MVWLLITTFYASILIFVSLNPQLVVRDNKSILTQKTANLCGGIGVISLALSGLLWTTMYGWQYGLLSLAASAIANFALFFMNKNRLSQVIAGATLVVGGSFFVTTLNMFVVHLV